MADNQAPKRPHYFKSQFLVLRDFDDEQTFHTEMLRRHNRGLHGWGAVRGGLQVTASPDKSGLLITPGSAIDNLGREIVLDGAAILFFQNNDKQLQWNADASAYALSSKDVAAAAGVTGNPLDVYLTISFQESESDDPNDHYPPPGGTVDVTRMRQTPLLKVEKAPPDDGSSVKLARVNVDVGGNLSAPDLSVRQQAGCFGPLSLTSADGTPQLGIDYDPQSDALRVRARTQNPTALDATHLTIKRDTGNVGIGTPPTAARLSIFSGPGSDYKGVLTEYTVEGPYKLSLRFSSPGRDMVSYHFDLANNLGVTFPDFLVFDRGNVGIGLRPESNLHLNVPISSSPVSAVSVDVQSFNTAQNAQASHFFRVRDIGGNSTPFLIRGDGWVGVGTSSPLGPLSVGDASVDGSDGYIVLGKRASGGTRQYRMGFDKDFNFVIGDYGNNNAAGAWTSPFAVKYSAPSNSLYINDKGNVGVGTNDAKVQLDVKGAANIWSGDRWAVPNNFMAPGSLTIGSISNNYGGGSNWNSNTAGLLLEAKDNTEIAVHDSGIRVASLMYYEGGNVNRLTVGRNMGWDAIGTLSLNGNVGIGTPAPRAMLDVGETSLHKVKSILARMDEGNDQDVGTCLGVKAYSTQVDPNSKDKSFALEHYFYGRLNSAINFHRGGNVTGGFMTFGTNDGSERMRLDDSGLHVTNRITIGDWTLECRKDNMWGSPRSSLYITYQSTDVARFGVVQDMLQIYPLDGNLVRHGYFYWNKDGNSGKAQ